MNRWLMGFADLMLSIGFFSALGVGLGNCVLRRFDIATVSMLWALVFQGFLPGAPARGGRR